MVIIPPLLLNPNIFFMQGGIGEFCLHNSLKGYNNVELEKYLVETLFNKPDYLKNPKDSRSVEIILMRYYYRK